VRYSKQINICVATTVCLCYNWKCQAQIAILFNYRLIQKPIIAHEQEHAPEGILIKNTFRSVTPWQFCKNNNNNRYCQDWLFLRKYGKIKHAKNKMSNLDDVFQTRNEIRFILNLVSIDIYAFFTFFLIFMYIVHLQ